MAETTMGEVTNVVLAGLGGQGALTASDILADAAVRAAMRGHFAALRQRAVAR